jgi:uncharacterized protein (TIGR00369 family)
MEPDGLEWRALRPSGFNAYVGPMRFAPAGDGLSYAALDLDERHMNVGGVCHGGVYMTLADVAMGAAAYEAGGRHPCATIELQGHFIAAAKRGQVLLAEARLDRLVGGLAFMHCELSSGGRLCLRASGIWKFLSSKRAAAPGEKGEGPESSA